MNAKHKWSMIAALIVLCVTVLCAAVPARAEELPKCTSVDQAAEIVREAMENREAEVTVTYPVERAHLNQDEIMSVVKNIYDKAVEHTGAGTEGDYLYFHEGQFTYGYGYTDDGQGSSVDCELNFQFTYYTTAVQEAELTAKIEQLLATELNLSGKSDYEKVRAIYDYICANVIYDYTNLNNEAYTLKYSAYAALVNGTSVCQGYANLFYRLANAAGVDTRIVSGISMGQNHAWNIVKLEGKYYNLDCTWDAGNETYLYFLKGSANFNEHTPGGDHPVNYASYRISMADYVIPEPEKPTETTAEPTTEAEKPTQPTTEPAKPTQSTTEAEEPTESTTEATKPTQPTTESAKPTKSTMEPTKPAQSTTEAEEPTEATTEAAKPTQPTTEAAKPTQSTTESAKPAQSTTEAEEPTEATTEAEEPTETASEAVKTTESTTEAVRPTQSADESEESTESTTEAEEPTETATDEEAMEPDPTEAPAESEQGSSADKTIYIVLGVAGVAVAGTAVGAGVVIGKKKMKG